MVLTRILDCKVDYQTEQAENGVLELVWFGSAKELFIAISCKGNRNLPAQMTDLCLRKRQPKLRRVSCNYMMSWMTVIVIS